jgi:hypothetical protein
MKIKYMTFFLPLLILVAVTSAKAQPSAEEGVEAALQLFGALGSRDTDTAATAVEQVLSAPGRHGRLYLMRAIHTARRLRRPGHAPLLAGLVKERSTALPVMVRAAAALTLGELARVRRASDMERLDDDKAGISSEALTTEEPVIGGCGGEPIPGAAVGATARAVRLGAGVQLAVTACITDASAPARLRQACARAAGVGSMFAAAPALRRLVSAEGEDPMTVLVAARALSRLTHRDHVTPAIRRRVADRLRALAGVRQGGAR